MQKHVDKFANLHDGWISDVTALSHARGEPGSAWLACLNISSVNSPHVRVCLGTEEIGVHN
jgi:hypothetical protein